MRLICMLFIVFSLCYRLPRHCKVTSLARGQLQVCPRGSEARLDNIGKYDLNT